MYIWVITIVPHPTVFGTNIWIHGLCVCMYVCIQHIKLCRVSQHGLSYKYYTCYNVQLIKIWNSYIFEPAFPKRYSAEHHLVSARKLHVALPNFKYLQTARVWVAGPTSLSKLIRCVLDSGSQTSFISTSIIDTLKLEVVDQQNLAVGAFQSPSVMSSSRRLVWLDLRGICTNNSMIITAFESTY